MAGSEKRLTPAGPEFECTFRDFAGGFDPWQEPCETVELSASEVDWISESAVVRADVTSMQPVPAHHSIKASAITERNLKMLLEGRFTVSDSNPTG
jgi:hypothetical protein